MCGIICLLQVVVVVVGYFICLVEMVGFMLFVMSYVLQVFVSELLKLVFDMVVLFIVIGCYMSQLDKGGFVIGGMLDFYLFYV